MKPNRISHPCCAGPLRPALPVFSDEHRALLRVTDPTRAMGELKRGSMRPQNGTGFAAVVEKSVERNKRQTVSNCSALHAQAARRLGESGGSDSKATARIRRDVQKRSAKAVERREQKFTFHIALQCPSLHSCSPSSPWLA